MHTGSSEAYKILLAYESDNSLETVQQVPLFIDCHAHPEEVFTRDILAGETKTGDVSQGFFAARTNSTKGKTLLVLHTIISKISTQ